MTDLAANPASNHAVEEVVRILQAVWDSQSAVALYDELQQAVFRLLQYPSSSFELRSQVDGLILVSAKYYLPLDGHVAMLYIKMIKWFLQSALPEQLSQLRVNLFQDGTASGAIVLSPLLALFGQEYAEDEYTDLALVAEKLLAGYAQHAEADLSALVPVLLRFPANEALGRLAQQHMSRERFTDRLAETFSREIVAVLSRPFDLEAVAKRVAHIINFSRAKVLLQSLDRQSSGAPFAGALKALLGAGLPHVSPVHRHELSQFLEALRTEVKVYSSAPPPIPPKPSGTDEQRLAALRAVAAECSQGPMAVTAKIRQNIALFHEQFYVLLKRFDFTCEPTFGFTSATPDLAQLATDIEGYIQLLSVFASRPITLSAVKALLVRFPYMKEYLGFHGNTLLYTACRYGYTDVAEYLLTEMSCNPNFQCSVHGSTALHGACFGGHVRCVSLLMDAGASPIICNAANDTPRRDAEHPDPSVKPADRAEILKLIAVASSPASWEHFDGRAWIPFPKDSQDLLESKIGCSTAFLVTLADHSLAEVDPTRFKLSSLSGEQAIRWRTRNLPSGLAVQFQYNLPPSGWLPFPAAAARTLKKFMEQARESIHLLGILVDDTMVVNLTNFDVQLASAGGRPVGHFRWIPCAATDDRESAAGLDLLDEAVDDAGPAVAPPRAPSPPPSKVTLELRCGQPLSDDIPTLYKFFRTAVMLQPGPNAGVVLVVTRSCDQYAVQAEIDRIVDLCQHTQPHAAQRTEFARPPAPTKQLSTVRIPLNTCATLRSFLLSQNSGIEESILAYDMYDKFRFRLLFDEAGNSSFLEVRGSPAQVVLMQTQITRLDYLSADVNAIVRQTCEKIDQVALASANGIIHTLALTNGATTSRQVGQLRQVFLSAFAARTREMASHAKASVAAELHAQLKRAWFPEIVADREGTGLGALTAAVRAAAQALYRNTEAARRSMVLEHDALQEAFHSLTNDLASATISSTSRRTLDNHLARLLSQVPKRACPDFHENLMGLLRAAVIQRDACILNLPLYQRSDELLEVIKNNDIVSLRTGTGTGKSSLLPPLLTETYKRIAVTQPRRLPCRSIAKRVDSTFSVPLCGWMMADESVNTERPIIYVTEGLLREWLQACLPSTPADPVKPCDFDVIILDEVHERSWNVDLCVALLAALVEKWKTMGRTVKIILASATIDHDVLRPFEDEKLQPQIKVARFALEMHSPFPVRETFLPKENPVQLAMDLIRTKQRLDQILVFLPTVPEVREAVELFNKTTCTTSYGLFANQTATEQNESIANGSVFFSTNIAETSLTFPNLRYVIDAGTTNVSSFQASTGLADLLTDKAPRSALQQRKGRLGRTQEGDYYGLYDPAAERLEHRQPQILLADLLDIDFSLRRIGSSLRFLLPFLPSKPTDAALQQTAGQLAALGLVQADGKVVPEMVQFPNLGGARITAATYAALKSHNCGHDLICLAAMLRALPSSYSGLMKSIPPTFRSDEGDIMTLISIVHKMRQAKNHNRNFSAREFAHSNSFGDFNAIILERANAHFEKFETAISKIDSLKVAAQKSTRSWEHIARALLTGYGSLVFCSQTLLGGSQGLYTAYGIQNLATVAAAAAAAPVGAAAAHGAPSSHHADRDLNALLSFDSTLSRRPSQEPEPWIIVLQAFRTPRQQENLTLSLAGVFKPEWSSRPVARAVQLSEDEATNLPAAVKSMTSSVTVTRTLVTLQGALETVAKDELQLYKSMEHKESFVIEEDPTCPEAEQLKANIEDLRENPHLFDAFKFKWRNEHQVNITYKTSTAGRIAFELSGRRRDVQQAVRTLGTFHAFLRNAAVVAINNQDHVPVRVVLDEGGYERLRRVTDSKRTELDVWRWSKGKEATRTTRMEVVAWVALCDFECRLEGGFVRDWIVRGEEKAPAGLPTSKWLEWDLLRGRFEVIRGVTPADLDMELPHKYFPIQKFRNALHKLGFATELQRFSLGYNLIVDKDAPTGPFTIDLIYPHQVATHDRVDFDVNNVFCKKDFTRELGMRVDISSAVTMPTIIEHIKSKELHVMKPLDDIMRDRIEKMVSRGWKNLGSIPVVPNRGAKFGASFVVVSPDDDVHKRLVSLFREKLPAAKITRVQLVSCYNLDRLYEAMKALIEQENGGDANELTLLHGTKADKVKSITDSGFDNRYWNSTGNHGHGAYFADNPAKAHGYTGTTTERTMFLAKVIVGNPERTTTFNRTRVSPAVKHHSVIYDVAPPGHKEYIVYRYGQVKPYALIRYEVA